MRRLALLFAGGAVWLFIAAIPVFADNGPHGSSGTVIADGCAGCHRAHTAKASNLLVQAEPALCYTCHGAGVTGARTDVVDGVGFDAGTAPTVRGANRTGALRGGGFTYALINSASPTGQGTGGQVGTTPTIPVLALTTTPATTSTHLGAGTMWGTGAINSGAGTAVTLACSSCHNPHGAANTAGGTAAAKQTYRILRPAPLLAPGTNVVIADVTTPATGYVYTTSNYWTVEDTNAPSYIANVSAWCSTCHTRYLAASGSAPETTALTGESIFTYRHRSDGTVQAASTAKTTPTCIQCHVAHGSNAQVTGAYSSKVEDPGAAIGSGTGTPSKLLRIDNRGTCQMCHNR